MPHGDRAARAARTLVQFFDIVCQMIIGSLGSTTQR